MTHLKPGSDLKKIWFNQVDDDDADDEFINKFADDFPIFQRNLATHESEK